MFSAALALGLLAVAAASPIDFAGHLTQDTAFTGKQWALLIAGSNTYDNYRHQADVYHAYQVLRHHGIPEKQIVVFHYDDIATDPENPVQGNVINRPNGTNVYRGVPKDYTGDDVTPANALAALNGDKGLAAKGKKVIDSTDKDHVFIYFADHGAPGLVAFPNDELQADDLIKALKSLASKKRFAKLVLYVEACESGSMFDGLLPKDLNIFATTAANPEESSYAYYCEDTSGRDTCLGDEYSIHWIEDSDSRQSLAQETLDKQFKLVKKETEESHAQEYGDLTIAKLSLSQFQGPKKAKQSVAPSSKVNPADRVKSSDVPLVMAQRRLAKAKTAEKHRELEAKLRTVLAGREYLINFMKSLAKTISKSVTVNRNGLNTELGANYLLHSKQRLTRHKCSKRVYNAFDKNCFDISRHTYSMRHLYVLVNACEAVDEAGIASVEKAIAQHCAKVRVNGHPYERIV